MGLDRNTQRKENAGSTQIGNGLKTVQVMAEGSQYIKRRKTKINYAPDIGVRYTEQHTTDSVIH